MHRIILEPNTLDIITYAYNSGILAYGAMTLKDGDVRVSLDIKSRFNQITVVLHGNIVNTLTLWDSDDNHDDIIRLHFGEV